MVLDLLKFNYLIIFSKFPYYNINNPMLCVCVSNVYLLLLNTLEAAQKILSEKLWAWSYDSMNRFKNRQRKQEVGKVWKDNICILFLLSPSSGWPRMTHISLSECLQWLSFFFNCLFNCISYIDHFLWKAKKYEIIFFSSFFYLYSKSVINSIV